MSTYPTVNAENISAFEFRRRNFVLLGESMAFHSKAIALGRVNGRFFGGGLHVFNYMTPCVELKV